MQASVASLADRLVRSEMLLSGVKRDAAERHVARRAGVLPGTLENLRRGRLKYADGIGARLRVLLIAQIERQITALETEVGLVRATSVDRADLDILGAETALEKARACLGKASRAGEG